MEPDRYRKIREMLFANEAVIPRGSGLSYCIASAGKAVHSISSRWFNRILAFDAEKQTITVESGIRVGDLTDFCISYELLPPVLPGHPSITIGGCLGFNVHGKTSFKSGLFSEHVLGIKIIDGTGEEIYCSRALNAELFALSMGGFGLSGYVTEIELKLQSVKSSSLKRSKRAFSHLNELAEMLLSPNSSDFQLFAWSNLHASGKNFGQGIVYSDRFNDSSDQQEQAERASAKGHEPFPITLQRPWLSKATNSMYRRWQLGRKEDVLSLRAALFPLTGADRLQQLYGRDGLHEYSVLVPPERWPEFCQQLEVIIKEHQPALPLTTIRMINSESQFLNFGGTGICVNIDFPAKSASDQLFRDLDSMSADLKLKLNLSKDNRVNASLIRAVFDEYDDFKQKINALEGNKRFQSSLRDRLGV